MTKRTLTLCLVAALAVASADAFASRARNLVTGTGDGGTFLGTDGNIGSFYVDDAYNMFYNPSYIMNNGEWATIEKDNTSNQTGIASDTGAMGGFTTKIMGFGVGFFMNRQEANPSPFANTATRPIELFVGGDHGVKWGLGVAYASHTNKALATDQTNTDVALRAGVQVMGIEPFFHFKVMGKNKHVDPDLGGSYMAFGAKYRFGEWTPYAAARLTSYDTSATASEKVNVWGFGLGRNTKLGAGAALNYSIGYWRTKDTAKLTSALPNEVNYAYIPIDLSASGDVTSWLTLRGGLGYRLMAVNGAGTQPSNATGRFGATINVGSVSLDWGVGSTAAAQDLDGDTFDMSNGLFTAASLTYKM